MPRSIGGGVKSPKLLFSSLDRRRTSVSESFLFSPIDDDDDDDDDNGSSSIRHSISYEKIPHQLLIKLSILKLDASSFDVQIGRTATVADLKEAVEDLFRLYPKENQTNISWSHVWGHFCLSFEGQKLLNDKDYIQSFRIKDGDQLHFIQHLSINTNINLIKRRSKTQSAACRKHYISLLESQDHEKNEENGHDDINGGALEVMNDNNYHFEDGDEPVLGQPEFKFAHFLKGWFSYSKLLFVGKSRSHCKVLPSRFSGKFVRIGTKFTLTRL